MVSYFFSPFYLWPISKSAVLFIGRVCILKLTPPINAVLSRSRIFLYPAQILRAAVRNLRFDDFGQIVGVNTDNEILAFARQTGGRFYFQFVFGFLIHFIVPRVNAGNGLNVNAGAQFMFDDVRSQFLCRLLRVNRCRNQNIFHFFYPLAFIGRFGYKIGILKYK